MGQQETPKKRSHENICRPRVLRRKRSLSETASPVVVTIHDEGPDQRQSKRQRMGESSCQSNSFDRRGGTPSATCAKLFQNFGRRLLKPWKAKSRLSMGNVVVGPSSTDKRIGKRPIAIDGQNVAVEYGRQVGTFAEGGPFGIRGIEICVDYFKRMNHDVIKVFLPHKRSKLGQCDDRRIFDKLEQDGHIVLTPDKSYEDRYIVQYAAAIGGVIVSNDFYRDLMDESRQMKSAIDERLLKFTFVGDILMFPKDPRGRNGPPLEEFLSFR